MSSPTNNTTGQTQAPGLSNTTSGTHDAGQTNSRSTRQGQGTTDTRTRTGPRNNRSRTQARAGGIPSSFTGAQPAINAVIGTRDENGPKKSFEALQDAIMGYLSEKYTKGKDLAPLIRDLTAIDISAEEPDMVLQQDEFGEDIPAGIVATKKFEMKLKSVSK